MRTHWYDDLTDLDTILGLVGTALGLAGLAIALLQLRKTRRAIEAYTLAIARAERAFASNRLLAVTPALDRLAFDLDIAITAENRENTIRCLAEWRSSVSLARGLLEGSPHAAEPLMDALRTSALQASRAKLNLTGSQGDVRRATQSATAAISNATSLLSELSGRLQSTVSEGQPDA